MCICQAVIWSLQVSKGHLPAPEATPAPWREGEALGQEDMGHADISRPLVSSVLEPGISGCHVEACALFLFLTKMVAFCPSLVRNVFFLLF